ncbi:hypothetical protein [uncultured Rheinheimera sp.]|uniref:hypothetical protein n=1 Tax=uncultured Rheinheimera sp. TaxID=400532 RepID=UPI0025980189|nr:hypothetical protein [uncultured Rheinheimera sp.]
MNKKDSSINDNKYLKSAIEKLYGNGDDFILLGLTGRTGSGCSTAAKILTTEKSSISHSLYSGNTPETNDKRKEKIIQNHFNSKWEPFLLVQVRSVITTFLLEYEVDQVLDNLKHIFHEVSKKGEFAALLKELRELYIEITTDGEKSKIEFYTDTLPSQCQKIKDLIGESSFVQLYQEVGKNIRLSGEPFQPTLNEGKFFTLAEKIDSIVKEIHAEQTAKGKNTFIVIDAIRSPLEAIYFQDRYASFYLIAVSTPEADRIGRLRKLKYSESDIEKLDRAEYTARDLNEEDFYSVQDIPSCLQRADLYISNQNENAAVNKYQNLANQLIRFVSLIRHPGIVTPSPIERCMQMAYTAKLNSGCISRQVGAVVTDKNYSVRSVGWNDAPFGQVPCNLRNRDDLLGGIDSQAYSEFERTDEKYIAHFKLSTDQFKSPVLNGRNKSFCFKSEYNSYKKEKNQVHTRSLHAEENAFLQIAKYGLATIEGGTLFTTASPCELCAKKAYQLGITDIVYIDPYPGIAVTHILQGGTRNPTLKLFSGAIGKAFHRLYSPIVPYKDELNALIR